MEGNLTNTLLFRFLTALAIGLLVGINLVLGGASLVGMALAARKA